MEFLKQFLSCVGNSQNNVNINENENDSITISDSEK